MRYSPPQYSLCFLRTGFTLSLLLCNVLRSLRTSLFVPSRTRSLGERHHLVFCWRLSLPRLERLSHCSWVLGLPLNVTPSSSVTASVVITTSRPVGRRRQMSPHCRLLLRSKVARLPPPPLIPRRRPRKPLLSLWSSVTTMSLRMMTPSLSLRAPECSQPPPPLTSTGMLTQGVCYR